MSLSDRLEKLQKKPYETRIKILWGTVIICGVILLLVWMLSLKNVFSNVDSKSLIKVPVTQTQTSPGTSTEFVAVERVEQTQTSLKIYFNINNPTDDILNVSKLNNVSLTEKNNTTQPKQITDRQGQAFVQKVLSHTQNFGILTFSGTNASSGTLTFDQMFFEKSSDKLFSQTLNLDFNKLNQESNLRN
jgi:hypothetical protein